MSNHEDFMREALLEASRAEGIGEVPVGAVLVLGGNIITRGHNEVECRHDATRHAEMLVIQRAAAALGSWRLSSASLYVTLEPCTMCIGALVLSRVANLIFGAWDPRQGAVGSLYDLATHPDLPHTLKVTPEVLRGDCEQQLKAFFAQCRNRPPVP